MSLKTKQSARAIVPAVQLNELILHGKCEISTLTKWRKKIWKWTLKHIHFPTIERTIYICLVKLLISANLFVQGGGKVYSLSHGINISFVNLIANYELRWNDKDAWPLQTIDKYRLLTGKSFCMKSIGDRSITLLLQDYVRVYTEETLLFSNNFDTPLEMKHFVF